jgi:hypothetical protein
MSTASETQSGGNRLTPEAVVHVEGLEAHHLTGLLDHSVDAVVVPNWFTAEACLAIAERIKQSQYYSAYPDYPTVGRLGQELFECATEGDLARYQADALTLIRDMRRLSHPYISPVDRLRLELDDIWANGCNLAKLGEKKTFAGVVREYQETSSAEPHCDVIAWDILPSRRHQTAVINQIAANVYLKTSQSGGEIQLWDEWPTQSSYNMAHNSEGIGLDNKKIPPPKLEIAPRQGDLILFNSMRIHSVKEIKSGVRMTWACFIGYSGPEAPLVVWS